MQYIDFGLKRDIEYAVIISIIILLLYSSSHTHKVLVIYFHLNKSTPVNIQYCN